MAAQGDIIKSFLVGLGFEIDEGSLRLFNSEIAKAATRVTAVYTAVNAFAGAIVFAFSRISEGFEQMGYQYHIIAPSINKMIVLRNEMVKAYTAAGINIRKVIVDSYKLNMSFAKTRLAMEAIYKSVASRFFHLLTQQSDGFRKRLYENMPYIINALEKLVKAVFLAFKAVTILGGRVWSILGRIYDFFVSLDKATDGWSTVIFGLIAAWKLLNLSFLATPLGALIGGFTALLALWDDFKTFKEGGKSLINWDSSTVKEITGLVATIVAVATAVEAVVLATKAWGLAQAGVNGLIAAFDALAAANPIGLIVIGITALVAALDLVDAKWNVFGGHVSGFFSGLGGKILNLVGGSTNTAGLTPSGPALGANPSSGHQNVNANMQTQINIAGSPNADATARLTAIQQQNVNRDFVRNLKGATR